MNFSKTKVLFRCDSGDVSQLGSGHLFRSITIAKFLKKKFKLKYKDIIFVTKTKKKFSKSSKILKNFNFKVFKIDTKIKNYSNKEAQILNRFKGKLVIIDRLGKVNIKFIHHGLKNFERKIIFDDSSIYRNHFDISFNPLITNVKKLKNNYIGLKKFISPIYFYKKKKIKPKNGVFIFFGNYDKNNILKKIFINNQYKQNIVFYLPETYKKVVKSLKIKNKIYFFKMDKFYYYMQKSKFVVVSGGMTVFDALYMNKKIICIPQYRHQFDNLYSNKIQNNLILLKYGQKKFKSEFSKFFEKMIISKIKIKKRNQIINRKNMSITLNSIGKKLNG